MSFCLPIEKSKAFLNALRGREIEPEKLMDMTSAERRDFFSRIVGPENAADVNALFESKLLLQDQKRGLVTWAKKVAGLSESARSDMVSRIAKLDRVLNPEEEKAFLEDLATERLGVRVSSHEARNIGELSKAERDARPAWDGKHWTNEADRLKYGAARVALLGYVNGLKQTIKPGIVAAVRAEAKTNPLGAIKNSVTEIAGFAKSVKASLDNSFWLRQGFKTIFTNPVIWGRKFIKSWVDITQSLRGRGDVVRAAVHAEVYSRENSMNGLYRRAGLDIGTGEEYYPSLAPEKIPLLGRLFKASNIAFESGAMRLRADIFDKYVGIAREGGVDLSNDLEVRSIGKLVNTLTGRGSLGPLEKIGKTVNVVLFSPKFLASNVEFLTAHLVSFDAKMSPFARKQAAVNLMKVTAGLAGVAIIANAIFPGCVEYDPRSSDFMKIRIGNTRFDISGGMASVITLAARLTTLSTKNARGQVRPLNEKGYGKRSALDVFVDFMAGKASPAFAPVVDYLRGSTFGGKPVTLVGEVENVFVPFPITNVQELLTTPGGANPLLGEAADALGISVNTYQ